MSNFKYAVFTQKSFESAVEAVIKETVNFGFKVIIVHNIQENLRVRGLKIEPIKIIEICHPKYAYQLIQKNPALALMLPCKIVVSQRHGAVAISALRPTIIRKIFSNIDQKKLISEIDGKLKLIVGNSA